jgi:hypothetical protein
VEIFRGKTFTISDLFFWSSTPLKHIFRLSISKEQVILRFEDMEKPYPTIIVDNVPSDEISNKILLASAFLRALVHVKNVDKALEMVWEELGKYELLQESIILDASRYLSQQSINSFILSCIEYLCARPFWPAFRHRHQFLQKASYDDALFVQVDDQYLRLPKDANSNDLYALTCMKMDKFFVLTTPNGQHLSLVNPVPVHTLFGQRIVIQTSLLTLQDVTEWVVWIINNL